MIIGLVDQPEWEAGRLYVENLARCMLALPGADRPELLWFGARRSLHPSLDAVPRVTIPATETASIGRFLKIARMAAGERLDFLYPFPFRFRRRSAVSSANWIPDLQHIRLPAMFSRLQRTRRDIWFRATALTAQATVVSSETVLSDLLEMSRLYRPSGTYTLRFATPLSRGDIDENSLEARKVLDTLPARFCYIPNQMWRHKDHMTAFRALGDLRKRGVLIPVVLTGDRIDRRNPEWAGVLDRYIDSMGIGDSCVYLGRLPRSIQLAVLRRATFVVQPSLFEGWSTVVEDCRSLDRPILLSNISTHLEQNPPTGKFFKVQNSVELGCLMESAWDAVDLEADMGDLERRALQRAKDVGQRLSSIAAAVVSS